MTDKPNPNVQQMVEAYIRIRDHIDAAKKELDKELEPAVKARNKLEGMLLQHLNDSGAENVRTADGTVYKLTRTNVSIKDKAAFLEYVREADLWDQMDVRVSKDVAEAYVEENGEDFPGVQVTKAIVIGVRRS